MTAVAAALTLSLMAAACGDDDEDGGETDTDAGTDTTEGASGGGGETDGGGGATEGGDEALDANGDGEIVVGVATPGPRDDGAYYQALVDGVTALSEERGWGEPIIVDSIAAADAATELDNLANQGVDIIAVGASEIADNLSEISAQYSDIYWYCNCGAGRPADPSYAQSNDDGSEINYTAGVATALLMDEADAGTEAAFIGGQGFGFEVESSLAFEAGLQSVNPEYSVVVTNTGSFNDVPAATEAAQSAISSGAAAVYPFLGGSHEAVVQLANDAGVITMSAGASDACERTDVEYQIAVRFDAADYLDVIFEEIISGELLEGDVRTFQVGVDPQPGAVICEATPEQDETMAAVYEEIGNAELTDLFDEIKGEAYAG